MDSMPIIAQADEDPSLMEKLELEKDRAFTIAEQAPEDEEKTKEIEKEKKKRAEEEKNDQ